ncbi:MAG: histidine phosphatase family protein [Pirellulales bacterium]|nr:histidine phosphatase family protein [Pirellulales bacterium]
MVNDINDALLEIVLIPTGSTEYDRQGRVQGTLDVPLSEAGRQEVHKIVEDLQGTTLDALYASPNQASQETGEAIAKALDIKLRLADRLHNLDHGLWQGLLIEDVKAKHPKVYRQWQEQPENVCPPQGETIAKARTRIAKALLKLQKRHKSGTVGLVVPEPLARVVRHVLRKDELSNLWRSNGEPHCERIAMPPGELKDFG